MATELKVWFSHTNDYENFEEGTKDADSFALAIPSANTLHWIKALDFLMVGTSGDEWVVRTSKFDEPITPTNFKIKTHTNHGSKHIQALKANDVILFVDFVGRKIRELTYSDTSEKKLVPDLTALAEHITYSGITSIAYQRNPDSILWATLDDGSLISMTYERDQDVVAWAKHPIGGTDVEVQSVCVIPSTNEDYVYISVKRTINEEDAIYIERMASRTFTAIEDCFFVDSGVTVENDPASTTIAGLDHLVGETVTVLGDGVVYTPTAVVDESGEIEIDTEVEKAQVGLAFTSVLKPMRIVLGGAEGSSMGSVTTVNELGVSFLDTMNVQAGNSESDLYDINFDDERWTDNNSSEITGLFTGEVVVSMPGGFDPLNPIIISTDDPLPCTVRAMIPKIDVTGR